MFASDVPSTPVIDLCGPGGGASGQVLHVLRGHVLVEYIRDPVRSSYQEVCKKSSGSSNLWRLRYPVLCGAVRPLLSVGEMALRL